MKRLLPGLLLALCVGVASAQVTPSNGGYLFRLKVTKAEHLKFGVPVTISGLAGIPAGQVIKIQISLSLFVKSIDQYHNALIHGVVENHLSKPQSGDLLVSERGQILNSEQTMMGFCLLYPKEPVKVGVPFRTAVPVAVADSSLKTSVSSETGIFTLVGFQGSGATRVAKLTFRVAGNRAPGGTILVGVKDGVIQRYTTDFFITPPGGADTDPPAHVKATVIRE